MPNFVNGFGVRNHGHISESCHTSLYSCVFEQCTAKSENLESNLVFIYGGNHVHYISLWQLLCYGSLSKCHPAVYSQQLINSIQQNATKFTTWGGSIAAAKVLRKYSFSEPMFAVDF